MKLKEMGNLGYANSGWNSRTPSIRMRNFYKTWTNKTSRCKVLVHTVLYWKCLWNEIFHDYIPQCRDKQKLYTSIESYTTNKPHIIVRARRRMHLWLLKSNSKAIVPTDETKGGFIRHSRAVCGNRTLKKGVTKY